MLYENYRNTDAGSRDGGSLGYTRRSSGNKDTVGSPFCILMVHCWLTSSTVECELCVIDQLCQK
jgi:hypothetical protein